ncbi:MAG: hypothetical protein A3K12_04085 [Candidatus Rokubacteria bacterium RIFCSPLOWO2_12_FULL_71_19]|nr:MAG: hypothetical protein A3K12_04085 [Candidatus Rokubacteria bacterium RIFCSPLOWO2_12_FULL_71_19]
MILCVEPIRFTRHARNRMRRYRIGDALAEDAVRSADWEEPTVSGRLNCWKRVAERFLRVTVREEPERIVVISAVFKRQPPAGSAHP